MLVRAALRTAGTAATVARTAARARRVLTAGSAQEPTLKSRTDDFRKWWATAVSAAATVGAWWNNLKPAKVSAGAAVVGLFIIFEQAGIQRDQTEIQRDQTKILNRQAELQQQVAEWKREDDEERRLVRVNKMRRLATRVHENASDAVVFARRSHFEAVASNYRSARPLAIRSMQATQTAFDHSLHEHDGDGHRPDLAAFLEPRLAGDGLVALQAVTLYYAASTVLHSVDEETPPLVGTVCSRRERRHVFREDVDQARTWLIEAQARAERVGEKTLGTFEPGLRHRIRLRLADATSYWHAVVGDSAQATQVYEDEERRLQTTGELARAAAPTVRLFSNHAMALFGRDGDQTDADAIARLRAAHAQLRDVPASATAVRPMSSAVAASSAETPDAGSSDAASASGVSSRSAFRSAADELLRSKVNDRARILRRKKVTVPSMLLFVASLARASDVDPARLAAEVVDEADTFLRDDTLRDDAWLKARGMIRVLDALFVALKTCPTDNATAADELAGQVIGVASKLATVRAGPHETTRGGDFGAFARVVASGLVSTKWSVGFKKPEAGEVVFSELARARRMEREAARFAAGSVPRRSQGGVLDSGLRERIANILQRANALV